MYFPGTEVKQIQDSIPLLCSSDWEIFKSFNPIQGDEDNSSAGSLYYALLIFDCYQSPREPHCL